MKKDNGITLIALVITVVVLIILAGMAINLSLGENGIFNKAKRAREETLIASAKEKLEIKAAEVQIEKEGHATLKDFAEYLDEDEATYIISLTKTSSVTGGIPNLENATEMYVTYNNFEFKVDNNLKILYVGNNGENISGNGNTNSGGNSGSSSSGEGSGSSNLYGCRAYAEVIVTDAIMGEMTLNVDVSNAHKLKAIEYYIDGNLVHTGLEQQYTVTGLQSEVEYKVSAIVEYEPDEILTVAKIQDIAIVSVNLTHTASVQSLSWDMLEKLSRVISNSEGTGEKQVNSDSAGVTFAVGKETCTIGRGDTFTLDGKTVRLLGFNHDELVDNTVYGGTNNTHAGISFEYIDFITTASMNGTNTTGWGECPLRNELNDLTNAAYKNIVDIAHIKQVKKQYNEDVNDTKVSYSNDYLWLLSFEEVWGNQGLRVRKSRNTI